MIDIRDLRIGAHVAHRRYPNRVCRIECIMPTSVYLSYMDNCVRVKMFNVPIDELKQLEITPAHLEKLSDVTGIPKENTQFLDYLTLETFAWIEFGEEIITE